MVLTGTTVTKEEGKTGASLPTDWMTELLAWWPQKSSRITFFTQTYISGLHHFPPAALANQNTVAFWQKCVWGEVSFKTTTKKERKHVRMSHHLLTCQLRGISWNGSAGTGSDSCAWSDSSHSSHTSCSWCSAGCCGGKNPDTQKQKKNRGTRAPKSTDRTCSTGWCFFFFF